MAGVEEDRIRCVLGELEDHVPKLGSWEVGTGAFRIGFGEVIYRAFREGHDGCGGRLEGVRAKYADQQKQKRYNPGNTLTRDLRFAF